MNPLTRSLLASSDIGAVFRITALKISMVVVGVALDSVPKVQAVLLLLAVDGVAYYYFWQVCLWTADMLAWVAFPVSLFYYRQSGSLTFVCCPVFSRQSFSHLSMVTNDRRVAAGFTTYYCTGQEQ